mgnify:CR=1 FL=1
MHLDNIYRNKQINNMTYNKLNSILKNNSEIHFITDSENFFDENNLDMNDFKDNKFIIFEYTSNINKCSQLLKDNNINFIRLEDELDLEFIII